MFARARTTSGVTTTEWSERVVVVDTQAPLWIEGLRLNRVRRESDTPDAIFNNSPSDVMNYERPQFQWIAPADVGSAGIGNRVVYQIQSLDRSVLYSGEWNLETVARTTGVFEVGISLSDGTYRIWASAVDKANNFGNWGLVEGGEFTVDTQRPTLPVVLAGPPSGTSAGAPLEFTWLPSTDSSGEPVRYVVELFKAIPQSPSNETLLYFPSSNSLVVTLNLGAGDYWWRVRAFDQGATSSSSAYQAFTLV